MSLSIIAACSRTGVEPNRPLVAVSIAPQKYFVKKIAGDRFDVMVMIPPGASPHVYEPKPVQMAEFSRARAYFTIGVEFERAWLDRLIGTSQKTAVFPTHRDLPRIVGNDVHVCNDHAEHGHEAADPHIWLSPELVKHQVTAITEGLCRLEPEHCALFKKNDSLFKVEIGSLQDSIRRILADLKPSHPFMVFHPSWGYFAREFNLRQIAIEVDGNEPSPAELRAILDLARRSGIHTIFAQPQFSRKTVETISRQLGARVAIADPLAEMWDANLIACARALADQEK